MYRPIKITLLHLIVLLGSMHVTHTYAQVLINEVCSQNASISIPGAPDVCDWVELINTSDSMIDLNGYFISDDPEEPFKTQLNDDNGIDLDAGGLMILYPIGHDQCPTCLSFKLSSEGEALIIHTPDSTLVDSLSFPSLLPNISWGRSSDSFLYYSSPSPMSQNSEEGYIGIAAPCTFSHSSQLISSQIQLEINHPQPEATIHYTTDGSLPDETAPIYISTLEIDSSAVIRTRAYLQDHIPSKVEGVDLLFHSSNLNVLSISADPTDLFGISGIYDNYTLDEEVGAYFNYIDTGNDLSYGSPAGLELHSPDSEEQKSLRLSAKNQFGASEFDFPFFAQRSDQRFETLIARNAGEDGLEFEGSGMRDLLIHSLVSEIDNEGGYSAGEPIEVFLNGAYWGIYNLRERQDPFYIDQHFTEKQVHFLERTSQYPSTRFAIEGNWEDYDLLEETIQELDMTADENVQFIGEWMDLADFTDHQLIEIYICNQDWLSNNMKFWRPQDETEPWKWLLWDTDWGLGTWYPDYPSGYASWNALNFALSDWGGWTEDVETELLQSLVENEAFYKAMSSRAADLRNHYLHEERWLQRIDQLEGDIGGQINTHFDRWPGDSLTWAADVQVIRDFVLARGDHFMAHFRDQFELEAIHSMTIDCQPEGSAWLEVNTITPGDMPWQGDYFQTIPVVVTPHALPGFHFSHWEDAPSAPNSREVNLQSDTLLVAHYEPYENSSVPVINELMFDPAAGTDEMEWIELTHTGEDTLYLHGYTLTDGNDPFLFSAADIIPPSSYVIVCEDPDLFASQHPDVDHIYGPLNYKLSNEGELIRLEDFNGELVDEVDYQLGSPWPSGASDTNRSLELVSEDADNNNGANWFVDLNPGGSPGAENTPDVSIAEHSYELEFTISPNPSSGSFRITLFEPLSTDHLIELVDGQGRTAWRMTLSSGGAQRQSIHCELPDHVEPGAYILRMSNLLSGQFSGKALVIQ